jgi:hypothetical protein
MKKLVIVVFLFSFGSLYSQLDQTLDKSIRNVGASLKYDEKIKHIEGSPYFTEDYESGKIELINGKVKEYKKLNYNAYLDRFEYFKKEKRYIIANPQIVKKINYAGKIFTYHEYVTDENEKKKGFLINLAEGKCNLYKKSIIEFKPAEKAVSGHYRDKPNRFDDHPPKYFLQKGENTITEIDSYRKRKFLKLYFKDNQDKFLDYIKEENINLRKEDELKQFIEYYNKKYSDKS